MTNPGVDVVAIEMRAKLWSCVDADIDNVVSLAVVDGPEADVETGDAIRDAGAAQVPWVDGQWPPMDQQISISLTGTQWQWVWTRQRKRKELRADRRPGVARPHARSVGHGEPKGPLTTRAGRR